MEKTLENEFIKAPCSEPEWPNISKAFEVEWNFPNCLGAIDGKHVVIQAPPRSGSSYFNYKKTFSIVLMAICNAKYEFTLVDIGDTARESDGSVFAASKIGDAINNKNCKYQHHFSCQEGEFYLLIYVWEMKHFF